MALRFADFMPYTVSQIGMKGWDTITAAGNTFSIATDFSRRWLKVDKSTASSVAFGGFVRSSLVTSGNVFIGQCDLVVSGLVNGTVGLIKARLGVNNQVTLTLDNSTLNLNVRTGGTTGAAIGTVNDTIVPGVVQHIALVATIADAGSFAVYVNGRQVLTGSGDTQGHTTGGWDTLVLGVADAAASQLVGRSLQFANIVACDGSGATFNAYPGVLRASRILLNADGFYQDGTPSPAGAHYLRVNDATPDGATTTVTLAAVNDAETYTADVPPEGIGDIAFLQVDANAQTAGSRELKSRIRIASTNYDQNPSQALPGSFGYRQWLVEQNPNTTAAWQPGDFGAGNAEVGVVVTV